MRDDLATADLTHSVRSVQGSIRLADYLITRCIEAVVHGMDFNPAMAPEPTAEDLVAEAFIAVLGARAPTLVPQAEQLSRRHWIDAAAGRAVAPRELRNALPLR